jgi:uncharacterized membrane protein YfcA
VLQVYLPIAEMALSAPLLIIIGGGIGFLSGLFGISGGFLLTPLLVFVGVPPAIAVGTQANQAVASACAGMLGHRRRRNVDFRLAWFMLIGSAVGTYVGSLIFGWLKAQGQVDFVIAVLYVILLGTIGGIMIVESSRALLRSRDNPAALPPPRTVPAILQRLPFKTDFPASGLQLSILLPISLGFFTGVTTVILGLGGSLLVPAMIYLLAMPTALVAGTSLFQVIFTSGAATFLHAYSHHTVDIILAFALMVGAVIGAQIGARFAGRVRPDLARWLLAVILLAIAIKLFFDLTVPPDTPFSWEAAG